MPNPSEAQRCRLDEPWPRPFAALQHLRAPEHKGFAGCLHIALRKVRENIQKTMENDHFQYVEEVNKRFLWQLSRCEIIRGYIISPWYPHDIPMGIGWTDRTFKAEDLEATSQWNFEDVLKIFDVSLPDPQQTNPQLRQPPAGDQALCLGTSARSALPAALWFEEAFRGGWPGVGNSGRPPARWNIDH